jgi:hypothetical protein
LYRTAAGEVGLDALSGTSTVLGIRVAGTRKAYAYWESGTPTLTIAAEAASSSIKLLTANTLALTLDSSQNATFAGTVNANKAGANLALAANGTTAQSGIIAQANTGFVFFADYATATKGIKVDVNNGGLTILSGALTTAAPTGGTAKPWKVGQYNATAPSATGYVEVDINGTLYKLLAST